MPPGYLSHWAHGDAFLSKFIDVRYLSHNSSKIALNLRWNVLHKDNIGIKLTEQALYNGIFQ